MIWQRVFVGITLSLFACGKEPRTTSTSAETSPLSVDDASATAIDAVSPRSAATPSAASNVPDGPGDSASTGVAIIAANSEDVAVQPDIPISAGSGDDPDSRQVGEDATADRADSTDAVAPSTPALPAKPAPGQLSAEMLDELWAALKSPSDRTTPEEAFARVSRCVAEPTLEDCADLPSGFIGEKGDDVAVRVADNLGGCGNIDASFGWLATSPGLKPRQRTRLHVNLSENTVRGVIVNWRWFADLESAGYAPIRSLIRERVWLAGGVVVPYTTAILTEPLANWFVDVRTDSEGTSTLFLIEPNNTTVHVLGTFFKRRNKDCTEAERTDEMCGDYAEGGIHDIALSADRKTLLVIATQLEVVHCGGNLTLVRAFPLPASALGSMGVPP